MKNRFRFAIVGSGWRSLYYVRVARALPECFDLCGMLCRTKEKAELMSKTYSIPTMTKEEELTKAEPEFIVVAVDKAHVASVAIHWLERGFPVLAETPGALDIDMIKTLHKRHEAGDKLVMAEQYRRYPENLARQRLIDRDLIGHPDFLYLSLAHDYHAASLMRAFLHIPADMPFTVSGYEWSFPTAQTLTRYERFTDGRIAGKKRTAAIITFENGSGVIYDFDSEQYRSPIRMNMWKLQGVRGEFCGNHLCILSGTGHPIHSNVQVESRIIECDDPNPNLSTVEEITGIFWENEQIYSPPFGLCGLAQDETAIASLMMGMAGYARGETGSPYPLEESLQDAYTGIMLRKAVETGERLKADIGDILG